MLMMPPLPMILDDRLLNTGFHDTAVHFPGYITRDQNDSSSKCPQCNVWDEMLEYSQTSTVINYLWWD